MITIHVDPEQLRRLEALTAKHDSALQRLLEKEGARFVEEAKRLRVEYFDTWVWPPESRRP